MLNSEVCESIEIALDEIQSLAKELPFSYNPQVPSCKGVLRQQNSDFLVVEVLSFEPSGFGEHLFLQVEKEGSNTEWVIRQLIKKARLTRKDIGYAGKKDRHSISHQWFSLHLPGKSELIDTEDFIDSLDGEGYRVVKHIRHNKKLRVGSILKNNFKIVLRALTERISIADVKKIGSTGFPNYFGYQRFGRNYNNLTLANEMLTNGKKIKNRDKKGLVLSSARSFLFNLQLAYRVKKNTWNSEVEGDCFMLNNSRSYFSNNDSSSNIKGQSKDKHLSIEKRLESADIHICGWLPGKQVSESSSKSKILEEKILLSLNSWLEGLSKLNIDSGRRAFRTIPNDFNCEQKGDIAILSFSLPSGSYATSLLRELVDFEDLSLNLSSTN